MLLSINNILNELTEAKLNSLSRENDSAERIHLSLWDKQTCSCCSYPLLRRITSGRIYWRCHHCYQEMPIT